MDRPKPKFMVGQVVIEAETDRTGRIDVCHFDTTDGWEADELEAGLRSHAKEEAASE